MKKERKEGKGNKRNLEKEGRMVMKGAGGQWEKRGKHGRTGRQKVGGFKTKELAGYVRWSGNWMDKFFSATSK